MRDIPLLEGVSDIKTYRILLILRLSDIFLYRFILKFSLSDMKRYRIKSWIRAREYLAVTEGGLIWVTTLAFLIVF